MLKLRIVADCLIPQSSMLLKTCRRDNTSTIFNMLCESIWKVPIDIIYITLPGLFHFGLNDSKAVTLEHRADLDTGWYQHSIAIKKAPKASTRSTYMTWLQAIFRPPACIVLIAPRDMPPSYMKHMQHPSTSCLLSLLINSMHPHRWNLHWRLNDSSTLRLVAQWPDSLMETLARTSRTA